MLSIRRRKIFIALLAFLLAQLLIFSFVRILFNDTSFYIPGVVIYCKNDRECHHEVAHLMDHDLGDVSKTKEFGDAIWMYIYIQDKIGGSTIVRDTIISTPGIFYYSDLYKPLHLEGFSSPQQELYAQIYANLDGDLNQLPSVLAPYYSSDEKYDDVYNYLAVHRIIFFK